MEILSDQKDSLKNDFAAGYFFVRWAKLSFQTLQLIWLLITRTFPLFEFSFLRFQKTPSKETVAIVISCFNNRDYTQRAIDSIRASLSDEYRFVLMVMDDHSQDETEKYFKQQIGTYGNFCYFRYRRNMGVTQTWNDGVRISLEKIGADYIFLVNNDILVPKGTFEKMLRGLKRDQTAGVIGPLTNSPGHQPLQDIARYIRNVIPIDAPADIQLIADSIGDYQPAQIAFVNGFFMGFSKEALAQNRYCRFAGKTYYFNPMNRNIHNEDEFQKRLKAKGFKIFQATNAFVFHYKDISQQRYGERSAETYRHVNREHPGELMKL